MLLFGVAAMLAAGFSPEFLFGTERTVNKSYCHRLYLSEHKNCMQIFYVSASVDFAKLSVNPERPGKLKSGSLRTHFVRRGENIFSSAYAYNRIYDA